MNSCLRLIARISGTAGQTYTEFARDKEALFDRWCASKEVVKDFEKLRQLILVEEFKSCLPSNIKTYIDEQKANSLQQAAVLADDYSLTHHGSFTMSCQVVHRINRRPMMLTIVSFVMMNFRQLVREKIFSEA